jgi:hypothetical protein
MLTKYTYNSDIEDEQQVNNNPQLFPEILGLSVNVRFVQIGALDFFDLVKLTRRLK